MNLEGNVIRVQYHQSNCYAVPCATFSLPLYYGWYSISTMVDTDAIDLTVSVTRTFCWAWVIFIYTSITPERRGEAGEERRKKVSKIDRFDLFASFHETINVKPDPLDATLCNQCGNPNDLKACSPAPDATVPCMYCSKKLPGTASGLEGWS
eukprot:scaffold26672_cov140-Skeletonema_menzelii.AAC.4